jgi:hypothetical protein
MHPEDDEARGEALTTMAAKVLGEHGADMEGLVARALALDGLFTIDELRENAPGDAVAEKLISQIARQSLAAVAQELFMPAGGFGSVAKAKGTSSVIQQAEINFRNFVFSGYAVCTLYSMDQLRHLRGGASLNKVWYLLLKKCSISPRPRNDREMWRVWRGYKNVAHVGAAAYLLWARSGHPNDTLYLRRDLQRFLKIAKRFELYLLARSEKIVEPEEIWRVPMNAIADDNDMPGRLSVASQLHLASYRAPVPSF